MIYPIINMKTVGTPVKLVERNLAIRPDIGAVSDGIVFLVQVGDTRFLVDQRGNFYYNADGEKKMDWYNPDRLEYLGSDRVSYNYSGTKIASVGPYNLYYDYSGERVERISNYLIHYETSSSTSGYIDHAGDVYFYYNEYNYSTGRSQATKIGECSLYYKAGGQLDKVTYYGNTPGDPKSPWYNQYCRDNTVYIYYDYYGKITKIGSTNIY